MSKKWFSMANVKKVTIRQDDFGPSITQPDESLTIRQILHRVASGLTTGLADFPSNGEYDPGEDLDMDDPTLEPEFDKLDALEYATSEEADNARQELNEGRRRAKDKKRKKEIDDEVQRRLSELSAEREHDNVIEGSDKNDHST